MVIEERDEQKANAANPMDVMVFGMMTVRSKSKSVVYQLLNALSAIEVNVSGIVQEVRSAEMRRRASALVKTVMLGEGRMEKSC